MVLVLASMSLIKHLTGSKSTIRLFFSTNGLKLLLGRPHATSLPNRLKNIQVEHTVKVEGELRQTKIYFLGNIGPRMRDGAEIHIKHTGIPFVKFGKMKIAEEKG